MKTEDLINEAKEFFEYYKKEIGKSAKEGDKIIQVSFQDLSASSHKLSEFLLEKPEETLQLLEIALEEIGLISNPRVRFFDLPPSQHVEIRDLRAKHINQFISVSGIIKQASDVRPKVVNAKFECPSCGSNMSILQTDNNFREPKRCTCGRKGNFRLVNKEMVDAQRIVIEESPEDLLGGEQPRRLNIFLKEDLVDPKMEKRTTPGAKVTIIGVLKEVPVPLKTGAISTKFDLAVESNNVIPMEETFEELNIGEEDEKKIKELASDPQLYEKLVGSIAPSIYGHEKVKESLVLQLFGGVKKIKSDGSAARGDMHILLVGDPGVAKSVMLKFIAGISPKGRYVGGRSTTGAGLTATIVRDEFLRGWSLEAGTMVLSHKGIACIDELEDMREEDRSCMHEALEQQTVSISKANVQATLKTETSVLAAANPKFGRFDPIEPIYKQLDIDTALLTRFDMIFILKDKPERVKDDAIATHVLLGHRKMEIEQPIDSKFFKKYVAYAKQHIKPEITEKAADEIRNFYVNLRNSSSSLVADDTSVKPIPITARQLEALIRMAEANAKARLSKKVTREDALKAIDLLKYCLMQVGFDYSTNQLDIDRISSNMPSSQRSKIILVREAIKKLEQRLGKMISIEELIRDVGDKVDIGTIEETLDSLNRTGDIFRPRKGFIQRVS